MSSVVTDWDKVRAGQVPTKVCLCGSTKFKNDYEYASRQETIEGRIVISVGLFGHRDPAFDQDGDLKKKLDMLHLRKIDDCDEILVINTGGYIGESTTAEIAYAESTGKRVRYMYNPPASHTNNVNR